MIQKQQSLKRYPKKNTQGKVNSRALVPSQEARLPQNCCYQVLGYPPQRDHNGTDMYCSVCPSSPKSLISSPSCWRAARCSTACLVNILLI